MAGQNTLIVSDSTLSRIRKFEFSANVRGRSMIKSLPGEKANVMHSFLRAKLGEYRRSCVVVHGGTNNMCNIEGRLADQSAESIADELISMGDSCKEFGVTKIVFCGITVRRNGWEVETKRREINSLLRSRCIEKGYVFIENDNIVIDDIENKPRDKVHLLESGSVKLANNILRVLNETD